MNTFSTRSSRSALALMALTLAAGSVHAQTVTPPPAEIKDPAKEFTPPPPAPAEAAPAQAVPVRAKPQMPAMPKDVDYNALIKKDEKGAVLPLSEPVHLAALRVNTKLPAGFVDGLTEYLAERRTRIVHLLVANLDIVEKIDEGIFEQTQRVNMTQLIDTMKPIVQTPAPKTITEELRDKQMLDTTQALVNGQIVRTYTLAGVPPVDRKAEIAAQGQAAWFALVQLYKSMTDEYTFLLASAHKTIAEKSETVFTPELLKKLEGMGVDATKQAAMRDKLIAATKLKAGSAEYAEAMKAWREATTLDQRKAVYEAALAKK